MLETPQEHLREAVTLLMDAANIGAGRAVEGEQGISRAELYNIVLAALRRAEMALEQFSVDGGYGHTDKRRHP